MPKTRNHEKRLRALIIEDVEDDALLLVDYLEASGITLAWQRVDTEKAMRKVIQKNWDIVFSDYSMPEFSGAHALKILRQYDPDIPFIFVSGTIGEDVAVEAIKAGAQDYVMKGQLTRLPPTVERELREARLRREHRQAEDTLRKLSLVVLQTADCVYITDPRGHIEYVNPAFEKLTGYSIDEAKGRTPGFLGSGDYDDKFYQRLWKTIEQGRIFRGNIINRHKNGTLFYEEKVITPLIDSEGLITHFVSTGRDITARIKADEERARMVAILEATPDLVAMLEPNGCLHYLNDAGRRLLGLDPEENIEGRCLTDIFPEFMAEQFTATILPAIERDGSWSGEATLQLNGGTEMPVSQVMLAHYDASGNIEYISSIGRDISERKRFEIELQHKATHDSLTGLPNRFLLSDRLTSEMEYARRHNRYIAVLFLDLDNFKRINDTLGHAAGDTLLQQVSQRLRNCLRPSDTVARHGGDEFTIIICDLSHMENILVVLNKLRATFERPIIIDGHEIYITFSTGISMYPYDGDQVADLLRHADIAMYQAKSLGSSQYRFYAPDMNSRGNELLTLEAELRQAVEHNEFVLYYQPQIDLRSGQFVGAEGLIRWQHPTRGLVSPADFIPLLENSGLIIPVGEWVLRQACIMHRSLRKDGYQDQRISVNVSAVQFNDEDFLNKVRRVIQEEDMPPHRLELEITENIVMQNPAMTAEILKTLHEVGVRTAIDDFGIGYSSLTYLKRFPLNILKIDQVFVRDLISDSNDAAIVDITILLAQKLNLEVVAEGVETIEQLEFLRSHGCHFAQGYYLSRPMSDTDFIHFLRKPTSH
tara:strand:+ start:2493 stop:4952 length:2460 start_codon:yes stop_codon:yes gene_type:complete